MPNDMTDDLKLMTEEYEYMVNLFSGMDISLEIPNRHIGHAAILTKYIFDKATKYVYIFSGGLPEIFIKEVKDNIQNALNKGEKGVEVKIIVSDPAYCENSDIIQELILLNKNFHIHKIKESIRVEIEGSINHFCVSDSKMFRLEEIHPEQDFAQNRAIKAKANYNDPEIAKTLTNKFNELWLLSEPIL